MLLLAKAALGLCGTMALAAGYTFHEGVIRVDVDENFAGGNHIHFWAPATAVSVGLHLVPRHKLRDVAQHAEPFLPVLHQLSKELPHYPDTVFVEVNDGSSSHVQVRTVHGKLCIEDKEKGQFVHVVVPIAILRDVADSLEEIRPGV